ncbi:MBL fold metallo-hydrolase, partial [Singulisphaera rosea]
WLFEGRHRETIATLGRVRDFLPEDATIIPGHGRPMRPADIEFPLRYLRELDGAVRAAIAEGRSVEDTLGVATMTEYGEYSLFEWAHKTVNVTAAYRDLRETDGGH